jgi:hypothetical protein
MIGASKSIWGFDPRSVGGCVVWLDAADSNTLTLSGSNITGWRDKSVFGNNVTQISATPPTYNSADSSVNFVASSSTFLRGAISQTNSNTSVFLVASINTSPGLQRLSTLSLSANCNSQFVGQSLLGNSNNPVVITFLPTNTNPTGLGSNFQTYISNVTFNTRQLITNISTYIGTTFTILTLLNGNTQTNSSRTGAFTATTTNVGTYNKYTLGNFPDTSATISNAYNGKFFEYLVFSNALSVSERQQIEGYLVWKWGINASLATSNAYKSIKPHLTTFRPDDIPGCVLWFDGADYRTMFQNTAGTTPVTASGQSVACWKDNIRNLSVTDTGISGRASVAPTSVSGGGLFFNNVSSSPTSNTQSLGAFLSGATNQTAFLFRMPTKSMTMFTVCLPLSNNGYRRICLMGSTPLSGGPPNFLIGPQMGVSEGGSIAVDLNSAQSAWSQLSDTTSGYNTSTVLRIDSLTIDTTGSWFTNGTSNTLTTNTSYAGTGISNYPVNFLYIAGYSSTIDGGRCFNGTIYEILLYSKVLTTSERQQVEGYLAHKWRMTASLPATQPYKTIPVNTTVPIVINSLPSSGTDALVVKYDSRGNPIWARRIGGSSGIDIANSVTTDSIQDIIVVGQYASAPLNVYDSSGTTSLSLTGANSSFIVKYNSRGNPLWARRLTGGNLTINSSVITDSSRNVIVTGNYLSTLNIYLENGTTVGLTLSNASATLSDAFLVKYDSIGTPLWARRIGGTSTDSASSVSVDSSGNIVVTGTYNSVPFNVYAANGTSVALAISGNGLGFLVKYDSSGTPLWLRRFGSGFSGGGQSTSTDLNGNIIVGGNFSNTFNVYASNGTTVVFTTSSTTAQCYVVKYDSSGTPLWLKSAGGNQDDYVTTVATDSSGNVYVGGAYRSYSFFVGEGIPELGKPPFNDTDGFIIKYNSSGTPLWSRRIQGDGSEDYVRSLSIDSDQNVIAVGEYGSSSNFMLKYNSDGTQILNKLVRETPRYVATDSSQNLILCGRYSSNPISFYY